MGKSIIECFDLGKRFGETWGVKEASFKATRGAVVVLAGPNGAGKTTTIRILTTVYKPDKGFARVAGYDVVKEYREVRKRVSYQPQIYDMPSNLTPMEFVVANLMMNGYSYLTARREAKRWLETLGLWDIRDRVGWVLSGGERRRALLASILAVEADVYFLDEPTTGIDVEGKYQVLKIIRETVSKGSAILLSTHDMIEAQLVADEIVFMSRGKTIAQGSPRELLNKIPYRYKAVVDKKRVLSLDVSKYIDVGDKAIIYGESRSELLNLLEDLDIINYEVKETDLEDVYLSIVRGGVV